MVAYQLMFVIAGFLCRPMMLFELKKKREEVQI